MFICVPRQQKGDCSQSKNKTLVVKIIEAYVSYLRDIRRFSPRTVDNYSRALWDFAGYACRDEDLITEEVFLSSLVPTVLRGYELHMMDSRPPKSPKTVSLHMSALSTFCQFLMKKQMIRSNPVKIVTRPKDNKHLPHFFSDSVLKEYFRSTSYMVDEENLAEFLTCRNEKRHKELYEGRLHRLIISMLYSLGLRRAELIGLSVSDVDFGRNVVKVHGKGNKMREIPLIVSLSEEILLYLKAVEAMCGGKRSLMEPLLVTYKGTKLYPVYVDRAVKSGLEGVKGITGRRSPHVLRHSIATELMNRDTDLNSIKEMLGHSSLATTQVYTHSSIARLKKNYKHAHPRAKNGGKHGD